MKIVKAAQGRKVEGMKGEWKQFLKSESGKAPSVSHDPARHSWTTLVAFIKTFTQEADKQVTFHLNYHLRLIDGLLFWLNHFLMAGSRPECL